jgi:hypothetical protein
MQRTGSMDVWSALEAVAWAVGVWVAATAVALVVVVLVVGSLPATYFSGEATPTPGTARRARVLRQLARNALGVVLIVLGALLSIPGVPGQGLLTVLAGLILVDFPGRHRVARAIVRWRGVLTALNALRHRLGRTPLLPPEVPVPDADARRGTQPAPGVRRSQRGEPAPPNPGPMPPK